MPQYLVAVAVAVVATLIAKRAGLRRRLLLWLLATITIIATLWLLGIHPLGFAVSPGGWITFLITVLIGRVIERAVPATMRPRSN
jgi:hypothetical protein